MAIFLENLPDELGESNLTEKLLLATVIFAMCWLVGGAFVGII